MLMPVSETPPRMDRSFAVAIMTVVIYPGFMCAMYVFW